MSKEKQQQTPDKDSPHLPLTYSPRLISQGAQNPGYWILCERPCKTWAESTTPQVGLRTTYLKAAGRRGGGGDGRGTFNHRGALTERADHILGTTARIASSSSHDTRKEITGQRVVLKRLKTNQPTNMFLSLASSKLWWVIFIDEDRTISSSKPNTFLRPHQRRAKHGFFATLHCAWLAVGSPWMGADWYSPHCMPAGMLSKPAF